MSKNKGRNLAKLLLVSLVLWSSVFVAPRKANAGVGTWLSSTWNGIEHAAHMAVDKSYRQQSILKTVLTAGVTFFTSVPFQVALERPPDLVHNCSLIVRDLDNNGEVTASDVPNTKAWLSETIDDAGELAAAEELAEKAAEQVGEYSGETGACNLSATPLSIASSSETWGSGSLLTMAVTMDNSIQRDEVPVNMAYFFKDYARRVPVVRNTAFAQGTTEDQYMGANMVYSVWKWVRNISLGLMSLLLLVIGMMIMTRKKISAQATVTVQRALPRIAVSIVLIFFSYVIGSFMIQLMGPLKAAMRRTILLLIDQQLGEITALSFAPTGTSAGLSLLGWGILVATGLVSWNTAGLAFFIGIVIVVLALIIVSIIALVKTLLIYVKLLTYTIISPLYFAIGAVPGKESMILDWFKEMLSGVASVVAMTFFIWFSFSIPFFMLASATAGTSKQFLSSTLTSLFTPVMMLFALFTAIKMPKKVDGWIKGDSKKR